MKLDQPRCIINRLSVFRSLTLRVHLTVFTHYDILTGVRIFDDKDINLN